MSYKTVLGIRFGVAFAILAFVCICSGWRTMWFFTMPVAALCQLGAPASKRTKVLFLLGWVVYMGGVAWVVADTYREARLHAARKSV